MAGSMIPNASGPRKVAAGSLGDLLAKKKADERLAAFDLSEVWISSGLLAARPTYGIANRIYINTDAPIHIYLDTGAAWVTVV